jgi:hypothetical protein
MKKILLGTAALFFFTVSFSFAEEIPDWLKRVELSAEYETDRKPSFYFQTVQPLYQSLDKEDTFFVQPRISTREEDTTYNMGVGYRYLMNKDLLLGINLFGDYEDLHEHGRVGMGLEALGQVLEARANGYAGVTTKRVVYETENSTTYERVAEGADLELGSPIPYLPWLKLYGSGFWYKFERFDDKYGWKSRIEAKPNDLVTLEFFTWDDNKGEREIGGKVKFNLAFNGLSDFQGVFALADKPFPEKDLTEQTLIPVERNFDIVVESWTETADTSIEIARGN